MLTEELLSVQNLEMIWGGSCKGDPETKLSIYKVFQDVSQYLKTEHAEFILQKLKEIEPEQLSSEDLDLMYEIARFSMKSENLVKKVTEYLWKLLTSEKKELSTQMNDIALNKFCDLMKSFDMRDHRVNIISQALEQIAKDMNVVNCCKILKKIIDNFPTREAGSEGYTQRSLIEFLCDKNGLMNTCFEVILKFFYDYFNNN